MSNQTSTASLSESQKSLLNALPLDMEEVQEQIENARFLIEAGLARIVIIEQVWGTEFRLERVDGRA